MFNIGLQGGSGYGYGVGGSASEWGGYTNSDSWSSSDWGSQSSSYGESYNQVFGREASAQDIMNAAIANQFSMDAWALNAAYNAKEAQINRDFQEYMSNTAYQRAVNDLKRAGLNPILAAGNMGATTPVGSMASSGQAVSHKANAYAEAQGGSYNTSQSSSWGSSRSQSSTRSQNWGSSSSYNYSYQETTNNMKEIAELAIGALGNLFNGFSSGLNNNKYYQNYQNNKQKSLDDFKDGKSSKNPWQDAFWNRIRPRTGQGKLKA